MYNYFYPWMCGQLYTNVNGNITLVGSDAVGVQYPPYIRIVSKTIKNKLKDFPYRHQFLIPEYTSRFLNIFKTYVEALTPTAHNIYGESIEPSDINETTIFVNSEVFQEIEHLLPPNTLEGNRWLARLYHAAHFFNVRPLINAFASAIADRIQRVRANELLQLGFGEFSSKELLFIQKYDILKRLLHVPELTIADYIGQHGQPPMEDGVLNLSNKGLTSLYGINLILNQYHIKMLLLSNNYILGPLDDPNVPVEPFKRMVNLEGLYLAKNSLKFIPENFFRNLINLQELSIENNQLYELPVGLFQGLTRLQEIYLGSNNMSSLPIGIFVGLSNLVLINLEGNPIPESEEEFKAKHLLPNRVAVFL